MKRYKMMPKYTHLSPISDTERCGAILADPIEDPNGEWVKWENVKDMHINVACNCEEMYDQRAYWFCPAHGYKKR